MNTNNNSSRPRFYSEYTPLQQVVTKGLDNLQPEGFIPLCQVAKQDYGVDLEKEIRFDLLNKALAQCEGANLLSICNKVLPCEHVESAVLTSHEGQYDVMLTARGKPVLLRDTIQKEGGERIVEAIFTEVIKTVDPKLGKHSRLYINALQDRYGEEIVKQYLRDPKNKSTLVQKIVDWAQKQTCHKFIEKMGVGDILSDGLELERFNDHFKQVVDNINDKGFQHSLQQFLTHPILKTHTSFAKKVIETISQTSLEKAPVSLVDLANNEEFRKNVRNTLNTYLMNTIKRRHYEQINIYDGLHESYTPPTVRGLHSTSKEIVKKIVEFGDMSSAENLFNHEISSRMRASRYARAHTGPSNRSSTLSTKIALFFATKCGCKSEIPDDMWIIMYGGKKGIFMSQLEPDDSIWKESEVVTPYLKAEKCLGAVKLKMVPEKSGGEKLVLEAVDGFLSSAAKKKLFTVASFDHNIYQLYSIAKEFELHSREDIAQEKIDNCDKYILSIDKYPADVPGPLPEDEQRTLDTKRKEYKKQLSIYESPFIRSILPKNIPTKNFRYKIARFRQKAQVQTETSSERKLRIAHEKKLLSNVSNVVSVPGAHKLKIDPQEVLKRLQNVTMPIAMHRVEPMVRDVIINHYAKEFPSPVAREDVHKPSYGRDINTYDEYLQKVKETDVRRLVHGPMHCARTLFWIKIFGALGTQHQLFRIDSLEHAYAAGAYHDAAREDDGKDYWDKKSAELFSTYLQQHAHHVTPEKIEKLTYDLANKEQLEAYSPDVVEVALVHDADALEIQRKKSILYKKEKFDSSKLYIFKKLIENCAVDKAFMVAFIQESCAFIRATEHISHKQAIEKTDNPLKYLYTFLEMAKVQFPIMYQLAHAL